MPLFKDKIVKEKLLNFNIPSFDEKLGIVKNWLKSYKEKEIQKKTESQLEQPFNQDFFIKILDYISLPSENYTLDPKGSNDVSGQKADANLGFFSKDLYKVMAVLELKDANTSLDKSQRREGNLSPVQQAFKYKPQYKNCDFVIVSNFYEIRLYKDDLIDYEIFTLDDLCDDKDDYFKFKKFYYLLCSKNLISKEGVSNTLSLISETRIKQEGITKEFYSGYRETRLELMREIYRLNKKAQEDPIFMIKKSQKIIDRIIFACFCEDRGLLPDGILERVLKSSEQSFNSLWDNLKGFFNAIDKGSDKLEIPNGYNGGLFAEDIELNSLEIKDETIFKKLLNFSRYDFSEDLSIDILGHIFEQSISDLEEIKLKHETKDKKQELDKSKSKRKKDGIFYTPDYIVDYIVKNSVGLYLENKENELKDKYGLKEDIKDETYQKRELQVYSEYKKILEDIKVLDPACGSGAFLVKVFDYLLGEHKRIEKILGVDLFNNENSYKNILKNNIFGVDLNEESVEITRLSLWLKTALKNKKLTSLDENIKCGNSLVDNKDILCNKAFNWKEEFKNIMDKGGFDVIVGNPPYIKEYTEKKAFEDVKNPKNWLANYYEGKMDLWYFFTTLGSFLLKDKGILSYIAPNNWISNFGARKMRTKLLSDFKILNFIDFNDYKVFKDAGIQTMIFSLEKTNIQEEYMLNYKKLNNVSNEEDVKIFLYNENFINIKLKNSDFGDDIINFKDNRCADVVNKIKNSKVVFLNDNEVIQGIVGAPDEYFLIDKDEFSVFSEKEKKFIKKFFTNTTNISNKYIFYLNGKNFDNEDINLYPNIKSHFEKNKDILVASKDKYKTPNKKYYYLHRERDESFFKSGPKIISAIRTEKPSFLYTENEYYCSRALNVIKTGRFDLKILSLLLNSRLVYFWLKNMGKFIGILLQVDKGPLLSIPIIEYNKKETYLLELFNSIQEKKSRLYEIFNKFIELVKLDFGKNNLTDKIENWYDFDFSTFKKELSKLEIKLNGEIEENWLERFNRLKEQISIIKEDIKGIELEVNKIIYSLYGLNEDDIKIIEENIK